MSQLSIRRALEQRLAAMSPSLATAFENVPFTPTPGTPYQRANLLPAEPDNQTHGAATYFELGVFQITLCYPHGVGPGAVEARVDLVKTQFKRGVSLVESGVTVNIIRTPTVAPAMPDGDRFLVPISVRYQAQINL